MATNIFQVNEFESGLFQGTGTITGAVFASEFALLSDNVNASLSRYTKLNGIWSSANFNSSSGYPSGTGSFAQPTGNSTNGNAWKPEGGYYIRATAFSDGTVNYGYVGSFVGGYARQDYTFDANPGPAANTPVGVDYEPIYPHGAGTSINAGAQTISTANQWRDSNSQPIDGTVALTSTHSNYSRSAYATPAYFMIQMDSATNTIASGTLNFHVAMLPTVNLAAARAPYRTDWYGNRSNNPFTNGSDYFSLSSDRRFGSRALSIFMGRVLDGSAYMFAYPYYEDGTLNSGFTGGSSLVTSVTDQVYASTANSDASTSRPPAFTNIWLPDVSVALNYEIVDRNGHIQKVTAAGITGTTYPSFSTSGGAVVDGGATWTDQGTALLQVSGSSRYYFGDMRTRHNAYVSINEEYYMLVQESKAAIFSNKSNLYPLVMIDLHDTWGSGAGSRIGGAAVLSANASWASGTYTVGQAVLDPFGFVQVASAVTGATGGSNPFTVANLPGQTTVDGGVTWTNEGLNNFRIYFVSEAGALAVWDFNQTNGVVTALTAASALPSGQAYGACKFAVNTGLLYAITGSMSTDPTIQTTEVTAANTAQVGLTAYSITAGTWGSASYPAFNARHNARSLNELVAMRNGYLALMVEHVNTAVVGPNTNITNTATAVVDWQVALFNPAGPTWNTNQLTSDGTTTFSFGTPTGSGSNTPLTYEQYYNGDLRDVTAGPTLLLQCNYRTDRVFVIDASQALGTISNSNATNVSYGATHNIFPAGVTAATPMQIRKSVSDDRTLFWLNGRDAFNSESGATAVFYLAPPSWTLTNWTTGTLNSVSCNPKGINSPYPTTSVNKDLASISDMSNGEGFANEYSMLGTFRDHYCNLLIHGGVDSNSGFGEYGLFAGQQHFAHHNWQAQFFLPTYFKYSGGIKMADTWADAAANPISVPSTPGTDVDICYGLVVQFGSTGASSYATNEWSTFNVCWGNTKFVRKARYTWSMFAGQTFQATQTIPISAVNAIIPSMIDPEAFGSGNISITGPTGLTTPVDSYITCGNWLINNGGTPQNTPTVMTLTANHPDVTTILNRPFASGQAYAASNSQGSYPVTNAFSGQPRLYWLPGSLGTGGTLGTTTAFPWIAIDLGSAQTANSYSFQQVFPSTHFNSAESITGWVLQGSNSATDFANTTATWTTIDTQNAVTATRSFAANVATPGSYRYYRLVPRAATSNYAGLGFLRLFSSTMQSTFNFSEITFHGPQFQNAGQGTYSPAFMRGLKFEVSTNSGSSYSQITPIWRSHMGNEWCFARQTGITNVRITVQSGYTYYNYTGNTWPNPPYAAVGPLQFYDYGSQATMDAARLGSSAAADGTANRGSFDSEFLGVSADSVSISIDSTVTPSTIGPQFTGSSLANSNLSPVFGWWQWTQVPPGVASGLYNGYFRVHPCWGFVLFGGPQPNTTSYSGGLDQQQIQTGTNMTITYQWGRRI